MKFFNAREEIERMHRKLPHWRQGEVPIFVTFRLADSLTREVLEPWIAARDAFLAAFPQPWDKATEAMYHGEFSDKMDDHLDVGHGCCALRNPEVARIVGDRFQHFDGKRYHLWSHVVMPNHAHALFTLNDGESLPDTLQGWKGVSSRLIHKTGLCDLNPFWQREYFDRLVRSPEHFDKISDYVRENPVKALLGRGEYLLWERE